MTSPWSRVRSPWLVGPAALLVGLLLGAGMLGAGAQTGDDIEDPTRAERRQAVEAFVACAEEAGIDLPTRQEVREARRRGEPLAQEARSALAAARDACGDRLPGAERREALRTCLSDAGVLAEDGGRPDPSSMTDDERAELREAVRACADDLGIDRRRWCDRLDDDQGG